MRTPSSAPSCVRCCGVPTIPPRGGDRQNAPPATRPELRPLRRRPDTALARRAASLAPPLAFREQIPRVAQTPPTPADLLQALMREESALDPHALSWAGALGLTQLMPTTAWDVAARLKISRPSQAQLLEPDLNIRIGAAYLSGLVQQFKGVKQFAVASYNAGPTAVNKWRAEHAESEVDEWVENIPLTETRGYVKRVLRS